MPSSTPRLDAALARSHTPVGAPHVQGQASSWGARLFSFRGRARRKHYWLTVIFWSIVTGIIFYPILNAVMTQRDVSGELDQYFNYELLAKVTGKSKYAEDFRAEGMAFVKLLLSPMPHARVRSCDVSAALRMEGVYGVLRASDVPVFAPPQESILTDEPTFVGDPVLAVAAVDETTAAEALEKIKIEFEPLPFTIDPLQSLYPGGPDAHVAGNIVTASKGDGGNGTPELKRVKWTARDFAAVKEGELPMGENLLGWSYGDLDQGFAAAKLVLDETFVTASNPHQSMEPRSSFAYWQNGKCYVHGSSQSQSFIVPGLAGFVGVPPDQLVYIAEFCGGGFGSKGSAYAVMSVPAHMSKKINRPCMLRITRAEEYYLGSARAGFQGRMKLGFRADGKLVAADLYVVQANGSKSGFWDSTSAGEALSLMYSVPAMRFRAIPVSTNTPPCGPQRGPGQNQFVCAMEPILDKAARQLGIDRLRIREINAPDHSTHVAGRQKVSSSYQHEALALGAKKFGWDEKKKLSGRRKGSKVIGVGIGQGYHSAGFAGFDGLVRITPDGVLHIHTGIGNLGTFSHSSTSRIAAEVLKVDWERCVVERGDSRRQLPWNNGQFGSNTNFTMSRTNFVAATDALNKLKAIAAQRFGGSADGYEVDGKRVFRKGSPGQGMTYAEAAQRAIQLGGAYDGHEMPEDLNPLTKSSVKALAGSGLIGVAKDTLPKGGEVGTFAAARPRRHRSVHEHPRTSQRHRSRPAPPAMRCASEPASESALAEACS